MKELKELEEAGGVENPADKVKSETDGAEESGSDDDEDDEFVEICPKFTERTILIPADEHSIIDILLS